MSAEEPEVRDPPGSPMQTTVGRLAAQSPGAWNGSVAATTVEGRTSLSDSTTGISSGRRSSPLSGTGKPPPRRNSRIVTKCTCQPLCTWASGPRWYFATCSRKSAFCTAADSSCMCTHGIGARHNDVNRQNHNTHHPAFRARAARRRRVRGANQGIMESVIGDESGVKPHDVPFSANGRPGVKRFEVEIWGSGGGAELIPVQSKTMPTPIRIQIGDLTVVAELNDSPTAVSIRDALPIEATASRWGDEFYFSIPVHRKADADSRAEFAVGELGYWPPGNAFCIFFGPTPASTGSQPVMANPGNPVGRITDDVEPLKSVAGGAKIRIEAV